MAETKERSETVAEPAAAPTPRAITPTMMRLVSQTWVAGIQVGGPNGILITQDPSPVDPSLVPAVHAFVNELQNTVPSFAVGGFYVIEEPLPPTITSLVPATVVGASMPATTTVQVMGSGFLQDDIVTFNGYTMVTTYVSDAELDFEVGGQNPGSYPIVVQRTDISSAPFTFTVT